MNTVDDTGPAHTGESGADVGDFVIIAGQGKLRTHLLEKGENTIGRDPECDIVINDRSLSRRHAILRLGPPLTIQDLGSTNGVRVARRTVKGGDPIVLEAGESFHIGIFSVTVVSRAAVATGSQRSGRDRLRVDDPTADCVPRFVKDVATSAANVLVLGESGVGKDVLSETIHTLSGRSGPLARINCAALAEPLIDSELFGHEKGAFTGASGSKVGLLESAANGTVFLDEIGELPLGVQAKLLRAIESREILRIGSIRPTRIDVRFIAATNRDLPTEVAAKRFRHDLYFRLDGITLLIPPLRERRHRIAALAARFVAAAAQRGGFSTPPLTPDVLDALQKHDWPGNVRELKAVLERALLLSRGREIGVRHLAFSARVDSPPVSPPVGDPAPLPVSTPEDDALVATFTPDQQAHRRQIVEILTRLAGNQTRTAKELGVSRGTLIGLLQLYRIPRPRR